MKKEKTEKKKRTKKVMMRRRRRRRSRKRTSMRTIIAIEILKRCCHVVVANRYSLISPPSIGFSDS